MVGVAAPAMGSDELPARESAEGHSKAVNNMFSNAASATGEQTDADTRRCRLHVGLIPVRQGT
jgi:hypothetical protein